MLLPAVSNVQQCSHIETFLDSAVICTECAAWQEPLSEEGLCVLQFVADGVFYAELNELLTRELAEHGYSGVEVRVTPMRTEIIIRATRTQNVLGK